VPSQNEVAECLREVYVAKTNLTMIFSSSKLWLLFKFSAMFAKEETGREIYFGDRKSFLLEKIWQTKLQLKTRQTFSVFFFAVDSSPTKQTQTKGRTTEKNLRDGRGSAFLLASFLVLAAKNCWLDDDFFSLSAFLIYKRNITICMLINERTMLKQAVLHNCCTTTMIYI
jgi:hypothetical protein